MRSIIKIPDYDGSGEAIPHIPVIGGKTAVAHVNGKTLAFGLVFIGTSKQQANFHFCWDCLLSVNFTIEINFCNFLIFMIDY